MDLIDYTNRPEAYNWLYVDLDPKHQIKARQLCWDYNQTQPTAVEQRTVILTELLGTYHSDAVIEPSFRCDFGFNIHLSGMVLINFNCVILDTSPVNIGAGVFIAPGVCISCAGHAIDPEQRAEGIATSAPISIEDHVWIGANVTVCAGVTIGKGSVIGAGSVVTKDIPAGVVAAGTPCKTIRPITENDRIQNIVDR